MPKTEAELEKEKLDKEEERKEKELQKFAESENDKGDIDDQHEDGLYYFNREEKMYKIFNPEEKTWLSQAEKPSEEQINKLKALMPEKTEKEDEEKKADEEVKDELPLTEDEIKKQEKKKLKRKRAAQKKKGKWFAAKMNTFVYVNGLPLDITEDELKEFFTKCGVIRLD